MGPPALLMKGCSPFGEPAKRPEETRRGYIAATRAADVHDIRPLLDFARSSAALPALGLPGAPQKIFLGPHAHFGTSPPIKRLEGQIGLPR